MPLIIQLRKTISCGEVHQAEVSRVSTRRWEVQGVGYGGMQKFNVGNVCDGFRAFQNQRVICLRIPNRNARFVSALTASTRLKRVSV
jgi:hypothetical protein